MDGLNKSFQSAWFAFVIISAIGLGWFTSANTFSFYYHPNEYEKTKQIIHGRRNYNHPLLMLTTTRFLTFFVSGKPSQLSSQKVAILGRWASAIFAALTVSVFSMLAWRICGPLAGCCVGVTGLFNPLLYELSHYMKEDPALSVGVAASFLSFQYFREKRTPESIMLAGAACAIAASGKFLGLLMIPFALGLIFISSTERKQGNWLKLVQFLTGFCVVWAVLNYSFFASPTAMFRNIGRETSLAMEGNRGLARTIPHLYYISACNAVTPWTVWILAVVCVIQMLVHKKKLLTNWIVFAFILVLFTTLSFSPKINSRYALPIVTAIYYFAGLGCYIGGGWMAQFFQQMKIQNIARISTCTLCILFIGWQTLPVDISIYKSFQQDDRKLLKAWVRNNLPASSIIAEDERACLQDVIKGEKQDSPLSQKILSAEFAADLGTLRELKSIGVTHVAICFTTFSRTFNPMPAESEREHLSRRKVFYLELQRSGKLLWSSKPGVIQFIQPGLYLYDITGM